MLTVVYVYSSDMFYTNFVNNEENKRSTIIQFLNTHTIRTTPNTYVFYRVH